MKTSRKRSLRSSKTPGDGFYRHVNGKWLKKHHIAAAMSEYSLTQEIQDITDNFLLESIKKLPESKTLTPSTDEDRLKLFEQIYKARNEQREEDYLRVCLSELMEFKTGSDIGQFFGWLCRHSVDTIIAIVNLRETHPPYFNRLAIVTNSLTLPLNYYSNPDSDAWKAYVQFVGTCSVELGLPFLMRAIEAEIQLARIMDAPYLNLSKSKEGRHLESMIPGFEWASFMDGLDLDSHWKSRIWIVDVPDKIKRLLKWVCKADTELVVALFSLHLIRVSATYLKKPIRDAANHLFGGTLLGLEKPESEEKQILKTIKNILPASLCNFYSKQAENTSVKGIQDLVEQIQESAISIMKDTTLLSKKAHRSTLEKLHRMKFLIGHGPSNPLPLITYNEDSILHTSLTIFSETMRDTVKYTGKPANSNNAYYPCFQVNASYYPETNHIVLPWGILQEPLYSQKEPLGWNYGTIGATIGHEITHAFDLEGSMFSERAIYKDSWTRRDRVRFGKQTRRVSHFYKKFKHHGKTLNGKKTLSEDWADLGGIKIALHALNNQLTSLSADKKKEAHRNFFIGYATSWRSLVRKKKMLYSLETSVHSPAEDRVDRIVPQFQEWVDAFDIDLTDALFIPVKDRLKFF